MCNPRGSTNRKKGRDRPPGLSSIRILVLLRVGNEGQTCLSPPMADGGNLSLSVLRVWGLGSGSPGHDRGCRSSVSRPDKQTGGGSERVVPKVGGRKYCVTSSSTTETPTFVTVLDRLPLPSKGLQRVLFSSKIK